MNVFSYTVKVNTTLRPCSILGVADYFFGICRVFRLHRHNTSLWLPMPLNSLWATCPYFPTVKATKTFFDVAFLLISS